jgi:hypothetical protein
MRSFSVLAVLSAVLSAGAAQACCFFKCGGKAAPASAARMQPMAAPGYGTGLTITSVAGQTPVSNHVPNAVDSTKALDVVVEQDYFLGLLSDPELTVTDEGPHNAPPIPAAAAPALKKDHPPYKHKDKKLKWKKVVIGAAAAPRAGAAPGLDPIEIWLPYYEVTYTIPVRDVNAGRNYGVYASGGGAQSDTVHFFTAP